MIIPSQSQIEGIGREIFERVGKTSPALFSRRGLSGWLMDWSMRNDRLKTQLFRLVDVLPSLSSSREVVGHARQYLARDGVGLPLPLRLALAGSGVFPWLTAAVARRSVREMARTFILAESPELAMPKVRRMRELPLGFTADLLGETAVSEAEAQHYILRYVGLI